MEHFWTLYRYERKKLIKRRLVRISFLLCTLLVLFMIPFTLSGFYYVDGERVDSHYHMFQVDRIYQKALSGRAVDQQLLEETLDAYSTIPDMEGRYTLTDEYQTFARSYSEIFSLISIWLNKTREPAWVMRWEPDEESLYASRRSLLEHNTRRRCS